MSSLVNKYNVAPRSESGKEGVTPQRDERAHATVDVTMTTVASTRYLEQRPWLYSLCTCCRKCDALLESCCCFYCQLSRQYNQLYNLQPAIHWPLCVCSLAWNHVFGNIVSCMLVWSLRHDLRHRYGIKGSWCTDCLVSCYCGPCALQQQLLEMTALGSCPGGFCIKEGPEDIIIMT